MSRWLARCGGLALGCAVAGAMAETVELAMDGPEALAGWELHGGAGLDDAQARSAGSALRIPPGGRAIRRFREADGAGTVRFWVYDDGTAPADPGQRRVAPHWGVIDAEGRVLGAGPFYAPYLAGQNSYSVGEYIPGPGRSPLHKISFLGVPRAAPRWVEWTFAFDSEEGGRILVDGRNVNAQRQRWNWNNSEVKGFTGVVFFGDATAGETPQTIWIDDLRVELGGAMGVAPEPPPPPPPVVPDADPALEGEAASMRPDVLAARPRVLFGPEDLPALRALYEREDAAPYREAFHGYLNASRNVPSEPRFQRDATDGQRQGLWRMPTVAYHYLMTGDARSLEAARGYLRMLADLDHWETGAERDSGMSSANVMIGAALVFDWIHDQLDPDFREAFRQRLILQARRQYHGGHLRGNPGTHYWQNDPFNNHRWHRNAGMSLAVLAAWAGPEDDWILTRTRDELAFIADWRAPDGSYNEGLGYLVFGGTHLLLAMQASDRCFGTSFQDLPFFRRVPEYVAHMLLPGFRDNFLYGDGGGRATGGYHYFAHRLAARHGLADAQAVFDRVEARRENVPVHMAWAALMWRDPELGARGSIENLGRHAFFGDVGLGLLRNGWEDESVALMFKCAPVGGFAANRFRNERNFAYVNIAHDDPDANAFTIWRNGGFLAETSRYSMQKFAGNHNTILVNGRGQAQPGRGDISGWMQPAGGQVDMTEGVRMTAWRAEDGVVVMEGEAGGKYIPLRATGDRAASPGLDRYRRAMIWREGQYVLILDDVRAPSAADIAWLIQAPTLEAQQGAGRFRLAHDGAEMALHLVADGDLDPEIVDSPADNRRNPLGWRQLRAQARGTQAVRYAGVMTPWGGEATVALEAAGANAWRVRVERNGAVDTWTWTAVDAWDLPYGMVGELADGRRITVTEDDLAPTE